MKSVPLILRDHREELWRRWVDALEDRVAADYRELMASQLGERMLRTLVDELIAFAQSEQYERAGMLRAAQERTRRETAHRRSMGFTVLDTVVGLHVLRAAMTDVLADAVAVEEMPSFADTLDQLKDVNAVLDQHVCACLSLA